MSEPAQKCVNNSISNQNYAQKLFIAFKMAYSCRCGLRGNLDFPDFLQKSFITLATGSFSLLLSLSPSLSLSLSHCNLVFGSLVLYFPTLLLSVFRAHL